MKCVLLTTGCILVDISRLIYKDEMHPANHRMYINIYNFLRLDTIEYEFICVKDIIYDKKK
jgi:hypothetical protein